MVKNKYTVKLIFLIFTVFACVGETNAQNHSAAMATADTSRFSMNASGGWQLYNSYVAAYGADSVQFELIMQHANNINWRQEQYIGQMKYSPLHPGHGQTTQFKVSNRLFQLRTDASGKCYLTYLGNAPIIDDPYVVILKIFYKL